MSLQTEAQKNLPECLKHVSKIMHSCVCHQFIRNDISSKCASPNHVTHFEYHAFYGNAKRLVFITHISSRCLLVPELKIYYFLSNCYLFPADINEKEQAA